MIAILFLSILAAALVAVFLFLRSSKLRKDVMNLRAVVDNQENYTFLIDKTFEVKESNVKMADGQPPLLGNVLHCRNSQETGHCGEGEACKHCPIRFVINKSFERHDDFNNLEACMELGEDSTSVSDVDVCVNGSFVRINSNPHMVVNVRNITTFEGEVRPKVLFISKNAALYDKVRTSLGNSFRVLSADTEHQALHRLLHASYYHFCSVMTDASFYHSDTAVATVLNERKEQLPVFVFARKEERRDDESVKYLKEDINPNVLQKLVVATVGSQCQP